MEISAVMNIHDLAMVKTVRNRNDSQEKTQVQAAEQKDNDKPQEGGPGPLENTTKQQAERQATSIRVERQVDVQASKEAVQGSSGANQETGSRLDIIT